MEQNQIAESTTATHMEGRGGREQGKGEADSESNSLHQPLLRRSPTLSSNSLAIVGDKVPHIESLDYEINENDMFKHDWRSKSRVQVLQYIFLKWTLAFLVGLLTGVIASHEPCYRKHRQYQVSSCSQWHT